MSAIRRVGFLRPRKPPARIPISSEPADIVQDDYGRWSIGLHDDAAGPFESRAFAEAVAMAASVSS